MSNWRQTVKTARIGACHEVDQLCDIIDGFDRDQRHLEAAVEIALERMRKSFAENARLRGAMEMEAKRFREADDDTKPRDADYWRALAWAMATRMECEVKEVP